MKLIAENVTKKIKDKIILNKINLTLESGTVYGFVGRNGSGKTMLFRALSGLMKIDEGTISFNEKILHKDMAVLPNMGIVLENAGLYPEYTGFKNLKLLAKINNKISDEEIKKEVMTLHDYVKENFDYEMTLFRFPKGEFSSKALKVLSDLGYESIFWSFAYMDWDVNSQPDKAEAYAKITDSTHSGIYLLHAVSSTNAEIIGPVIDYWREKGYEVGSEI